MVVELHPSRESAVGRSAGSAASRVNTRPIRPKPLIPTLVRRLPFNIDFRKCEA